MNTNGNSPSSQIQNAITALAEAAAALQSIAVAEPSPKPTARKRKQATEWAHVNLLLEKDGKYRVQVKAKFGGGHIGYWDDKREAERVGNQIDKAIGRLLEKLGQIPMPYSDGGE